MFQKPVTVTVMSKKTMKSKKILMSKKTKMSKKEAILKKGRKTLLTKPMKMQRFQWIYSFRKSIELNIKNPNGRTLKRSELVNHLLRNLPGRNRVLLMSMSLVARPALP